MLEDRKALLAARREAKAKQEYIPVEQPADTPPVTVFNRPIESGPLLEQYLQRLQERSEKFPNSEYFKYIQSIAEPDLNSRILIEIPAYNDPELLSTMRFALSKAANPDRIHFAVCYQGDNDAEANQVMSFPNTKIKRFHEIDAPGTCAARYEASRLRDGEEYVLHTDSHMRFASFWDVCAIDQYNRCPGDKKVLTECNMGCSKALREHADDDWFDEHAVTSGMRIGITGFGRGSRNPRFTGKSVFTGPDPQRGAFVCAHFFFCRADIDDIVPVDPNLFFLGDEASVAFRLWTHGYNVWHPGVRSVFHLYNREKAARDAGIDQDLKRFSSGKASSDRLSGESDRLLKLYTNGFDPALGEFRIGTERSAESYFAYSGMYYRSKMARQFAVDGVFEEHHNNSSMTPAYLRGISITDQTHPMYGINFDGVHSDVFFVIVTAYKAGSELVETVKSLYQNADNPERVCVCVVAQLTDENWLDAVRPFGAKIIYCEPKGAGHAHYVGENYIPENASYVMYSEEHMYYVYGWDTAIACYMRYCGERAVLSNWAAGLSYTRPFPVDPAMGHIICARAVTPHGHIMIQYGRTIAVDRPVHGAFIIGHNLVVPARIAREIRHSPDMYLNSNESYMTYRYWCAGIDVYHAPRTYCCHYYTPARNGQNDKTNPQERTFSAPRMKYLLGLSTDNPGVDNHFVLGRARTIKSFASFSGLDPFTRTCSQRAHLGTFADDTCTDVIDGHPFDCCRDGARWADAAGKLYLADVDLEQRR